MKKYLERQRILALILIFTIILLNIFGIRFGFDLIIISLAVFALIKGESNQFVKDWWLPIALFFLYEFLRGHAFAWGNAWFGFEPVYQGLIDLEAKLFSFMDKIPPVWLQQTLRPDLAVLHWYDYILFFFYVSFFWYWLAVGFIIWSKKRRWFKPYMYGLVGFSLVACILYFFLPTAPPWAASEIGLLPYLERILWTSNYLPSNTLEFVSTYGRNDYAALPSLHTAWPTFASLFMIKSFGKKMLPLLLVPLTIAFATWYGAEHYVIDSIFGVIFAGVTFLIVTRKPKEYDQLENACWV